MENQNDRIDRLEEQVAYLHALAVRNEHERMKRSLAQGAFNAIMSRKELDMEFLHGLQKALGVNIDLKFEPLVPEVTPKTNKKNSHA